MNFWWNRYNPFRFIWDPRLVFSGFTVLGFNPDTGGWVSVSKNLVSQLDAGL